jgi:hypothetical protein
VWNMTGNFKINSVSSNVHSKCEHTIIQSCCQHSKCLSDVYSNSTQKQASFTVTPPRHVEAQDLEGGICNPAPCTGFHIHIRDTSPDRDVMLSGIRVFKP